MFNLNAPLVQIEPTDEQLQEDAPDEPEFHISQLASLTDEFIASHRRAITLILMEAHDGLVRDGSLWGTSALDIATGYGWCPSEVFPAARVLAALGLIDLDIELDDDDCRCDACQSRASWISMPVNFGPAQKTLLARHEREAQAAQAEARRITNDNMRRGGFVYLVKCGPRHKIGITKSVPQRMEQLQGQSPFPIEVVHYVQGRDYTDLERQLHERYAEHRVHGEWFVLDPDQVAAVIESMNDWQREGAQ